MHWYQRREHGGIGVKMYSHILIFSLFCSLCLCAEESDNKAEVGANRKGKIFYVSTTTSSSTFTTASLCYVPATGTLALLACKKRKKKRSSIFDNNPAGSSMNLGIDATSSRHSSDEDMPILEDPNENIGSGVRDGKFANYWITTTVLSTVTTYSTTGTLGSIVCTPNGWSYSACSGAGKKK